MQIMLSLADSEAAKGYLATTIPDVKSSHRVEALARALGYATNAALRADLSTASSIRTVSAEAFVSYLEDRGFESAEWVVLHALAKVAIRRVMDAEPNLTTYGILSSIGPDEGAQRDALLTDYFVRKFMLAWEFVSRCEKAPEFLAGWTSWDLKQRAESYHHRISGRGGEHIAPGCLIAAFLAAGFRIRKNPDVTSDVEVAVGESCLDAFVPREYLALPLGPGRAASLPVREPIHVMGARAAV